MHVYNGDVMHVYNGDVIYVYNGDVMYVYNGDVVVAVSPVLNFKPFIFVLDKKFN